MKYFFNIRWGWMALIFTSLAVSSCSSHYYFEGKALEGQGEYTDAAELLERASTGSRNIDALLALVPIYGNLNLHEKSLACIDSLEAMNKLPKRMRILKAEALMSLGRYDEAEALFKKLSDSNVRTDVILSKSRLATLSTIVERQADSANYRIREIEIRSLDKKVKEVATAASPFRVGDKLYFTAERPRQYHQRRGVEALIDDFTGNRLMDLWVAEIVDTTGLDSPIILESKPVESLNTDLHDGFVAYQLGATEGVISKTYVTSDDTFKDKLGIIAGDTISKSIQLFNAQLVTDSLGRENWEVGERLSFCDENFMFAHPTFSPDGKTLYFTSDLKGGYGGMDIWLSKKQNGGWSSPVNCGSVINTQGDEAFPTMRHADTLYFSSNGHRSLGGLDVVYAHRKKGSGPFSTLEDGLPYPINSPRDDFGVQLDSSGIGGFFASDRAGSDALYYYYGYNSDIKVNIEVIHENDGSPWPELEAILEQKGENLVMEDVPFITNSDGNWSTIIDRNKTFIVNCPGSLGYQATPFETPDDQTITEITVIVPIPMIIIMGCMDESACNYDIEAIVDDGSCNNNCYGCTIEDACNYNSESTRDDGSCEYVSCIPVEEPLEEPVVVTVETAEAGDVVELKLFWDYNKSEIREADKRVIAGFAKYMLNDESIRVLLTSYCDARATEGFNDELSQRRAAAVKSSLIALGVDASRMTSYGAGEQFLVNECGGKNECSEVLHQANRRTNARILHDHETVTVHRVLDGEILGGISRKYGVKVRQVKEWNDLTSFRLRIGQDLLIFLPE